MKDENINYKGILGTLLFHSLLFLAIFLWGFKYQVPPPPEEGVEVNLGNSDQGMGTIQPETPAATQASTATSKQPNELLSQNTEETVNLTEKKTDKPRETAEDNTQKINPNALFSKNKGGSEGITGKPGDQGKPGGDPNSSNYSGTPGPGGNGVAFSLAGRTARYLPKPNYDSQEQGRVVVNIWVNRKGEVTNAVAGAKGTTTTSKELYQQAEKAALRAIFNADPSRPEVQKGTITYNFIRLN